MKISHTLMYGFFGFNTWLDESTTTWVLKVDMESVGGNSFSRFGEKRFIPS